MLEKTIRQANLNYLINKIKRIKNEIVKLEYYKIGTDIGYYGSIGGLTTLLAGILSGDGTVSDIGMYVIMGSVIFEIESIKKQVDRLNKIMNQHYRKLNEQNKLEQNLEN